MWGGVRVVESERDAVHGETGDVARVEKGGIESFTGGEDVPEAPDARVDEAATKTGYEISFTRYFYKPQPLRTLEEIRADILALERETEGLLEEIVGGGTYEPVRQF